MFLMVWGGFLGLTLYFKLVVILYLLLMGVWCVFVGAVIWVCWFTGIWCFRVCVFLGLDILLDFSFLVFGVFVFVAFLRFALVLYWLVWCGWCFVAVVQVPVCFGLI